MTDMNRMFLHATLFKQDICGAAWVNSKANKAFMFQASFGSLAPTNCTNSSSSPVLSPQSGVELKGAVDVCTEVSGDKPTHSMMRSRMTAKVGSGSTLVNTASWCSVETWWKSTLPSSTCCRSHHIRIEKCLLRPETTGFVTMRMQA